MSDTSLLLISDNAALTQQVQELCQGIPGLDLRTLKNIDAAYNLKDWDEIGLVLIHQTDQGSAMQVHRLLRMIAAARRPVATIVLGETNEADQATTLLRMGVAEYLGMPMDRGRLAHLCHVLTVRYRRFETGGELAATGPTGAVGVLEPKRPALPPFLTPVLARSAILDGDTPQVANLIDQVRRGAPQSATVLLGGETGTGKTHLARQIHELSDRRNEPFLTVSCGTLSGPAIEEELFGHVRGAFEGAVSDRSGKGAEVGRGTLFLDGVDALPMAVQAKLLRVVEDRVFEPIGGTQTYPLHARLIAASNRPLDEEIAERRFRSDLFYRLNVVGLQLPPLRERRDAIPTLVRRFLAELGVAYGRAFEPLSDDTLQLLQKHDWPGNVRELRNVLDRCAAMCQDQTIRREDLPVAVLEGPARSNAVGAHPLLDPAVNQSSLAYSKGQAEFSRITEALEKHGNNRLRAAGELGISRMTLYKKLYKYGLMTHTPRMV